LLVVILYIIYVSVRWEYAGYGSMPGSGLMVKNLNIRIYKIRDTHNLYIYNEYEHIFIV